MGICWGGWWGLGEGVKFCLKEGRTGWHTLHLLFYLNFHTLSGAHTYYSVIRRCCVGYFLFFVLA